MSPCHEWSGFEHVYPEDSWLPGLQESPRILRFHVETALLPDHPAWHPPRPNEQYCYADMEITFHDVSEYTWTEHSMKVTPSDLDERLDYGNIDYLHEEDGWFVIGGDWGKLRIVCGSVSISAKRFEF